MKRIREAILKLSEGLVFATVLSTQAFAGTGSSGGGDTFAEDAGAAWFLGSGRKIETCVEISADFGVPVAYAKQAIELGFKTWRDYVARKLPKQDLGIAMAVSFVETCTGQEDLTFFLGTGNDEVRAVRARYTNPVAFSYRRSYDREKQWGQGWIWIAAQGSVDPGQRFPTWSSPQPIPALQNRALDTIIAHEIGHVLGVPHVEGTIMSERIADQLRVVRMAEPEVDTMRELLVCKKCEFTSFGKLGLDAIGIGNWEEEARRQQREKFLFLVGREPKGEVSASVRSVDQSENLVLTVTDDEGKTDFTIDFPADFQSRVNQTVIQDSATIFKRVYPVSTGPDGEVAIQFRPSLSVQSYVFYGTLTTLKGQKVSIIAERNFPVPTFEGPFQIYWGGASFNLKMLLDGTIRALFQPLQFQIISGPLQPVPAPSVAPSRL